jgi:DNA-directed RNA polymerase subunit RPC12/RpoP
MHTPTRTEYECVDCGSRFDDPSADCTSLFCSGDVRNVAVGRE